MATRLAVTTTVLVPLPVTCSVPTPPNTDVLTVSVPCSAVSVTWTSSVPASMSAIDMPVIGVLVSCSAATGPVGSVLTGASLTAPTVIETVTVADVSGASHAGPGTPQLSGSPRSVTRYVKLSGP